MKQRELIYGAEYAVNISQYRRWSNNRRGVYLGHAPWTFGGSTQASLHSIRKDVEGLEVADDGVDYVYNRGEGYAPLRLRDSRVRTYKDEAWVIAPDMTGSWRTQSPYGIGKAQRGLFALLDDNGNVYRWEVIAYGVRIERTWEREEELMAEIKADRREREAKAQLARDWDYALATAAIEIIDERGLMNHPDADPVYSILGTSREDIIKDDLWYATKNLVARSKAFLLGAGVLDSDDI